MGNAILVSTTLASHFCLSHEQSPQTEKEKKLMARIPYASELGSLMYVMVWMKRDIGNAVGFVSRFMSNPGEAHWEAIKWILSYLQSSSKKCLYFSKER